MSGVPFHLGELGKKTQKPKNNQNQKSCLVFEHLLDSTVWCHWMSGWLLDWFALELVLFKFNLVL